MPQASKRRRRRDFLHRYGPWGLVLGASEGIGAAFARELAAEGLSLILVARREAPLASLALALEREHGLPMLALACDLEAADVADRVADAAAERTVGLMVYNAASSAVGRFLDVPISEHVRAIDVNARALVTSAHRFGTGMARRGHGGIVVVSSLTAFQGTPLVASYGATKAFGLTLAEALHDELGDSGVDVLACCAGATWTPGYRRVTPEGRSGKLAPKPQQPGDVAREALAALGRRPFLVTGGANRVASWIMRRILSRRMSVRWIGTEMRRRYER